MCFYVQLLYWEAKQTSWRANPSLAGCWVSRNFPKEVLKGNIQIINFSLLLFQGTLKKRQIRQYAANVCRPFTKGRSSQTKTLHPGPIPMPYFCWKLSVLYFFQRSSSSHVFTIPKSTNFFPKFSLFCFSTR